jgi:hypothetical protein
MFNDPPKGKWSGREKQSERKKKERGENVEEPNENTKMMTIGDTIEGHDRVHNPRFLAVGEMRTSIGNTAPIDTDLEPGPGLHPFDDGGVLQGVELTVTWVAETKVEYAINVWTLQGATDLRRDL